MNVAASVHLKLIMIGTNHYAAQFMNYSIYELLRIELLIKIRKDSVWFRRISVSIRSAFIVTVTTW